FGLPLDYPTADIRFDRKRAGQLNLTIEQVSRSVVAATSSSRFTQPVYWRDPASGTAYQVQVEIPQSRMASIEGLQHVPANRQANAGGAATTLVGDVAEISYGAMAGEYDRYNQQRMVTITANIAGRDLGSVANEVNAALQRAGEAPRGVTVSV